MPIQPLFSLILSPVTNQINWKPQFFPLESTSVHAYAWSQPFWPSRPAPARTVAQNNQDIENTAFVSWYRQDQLIQNAILASVDPNLATTVVAASTSQAAWDALHTAYANKSQTRIFSLHDRLAHLAKETLHVADYLHQVRSLCDELATSGAPVSNEELIVKILTGLGPEFREISAAIRARDSAISYPELYEKLLDHELFIKHEEANKPLSTPITAAIAQQRNMHPCQGNTSNRRSNATSLMGTPTMIQRR
ncbi:uncharacterized protein [Solanum tuberosum]|uniref:uncharacterized protein n=1 Tax=Solanum tuberosum TaxID=4113 RepID=UPI00073A22BF|nr:PREDICTED: uncharacterized protein LOC107062175 [Solanum tuberosum]